MFISTPSKGSTAFLRRPVDPGVARDLDAGAQPVDKAPEAPAPPAEVSEERVLDAVARLEPATVPDATLDNIAGELAESPDGVGRTVRKLQDEGFLTSQDGTSFALSDIGKRALRYSRLAAS